MDNFTLPPLREDITLHPGPSAPDGSPTWSLFDPLRNQYYRIGWQEFEFLSRWSHGNAQAVVDLVNKETTLTVSLEQCHKLLIFLINGQLVCFPSEKAAQMLHMAYQAQKKKKWGQMVSSYMFFKLRLVHPERFLQQTLPYIQPLMSKVFVYAILLLAIVGLYLIGRQWDSFIHTFSYFFNLEGMIYYFIAIFGVKLLHELGHAYMATYYGVRVPSMGIVFMIFWPVFYTDTTDAWKLTSQRERLNIVAAGIVVELVIAVIATFAWSFLPEGPLKSAAFFIATVSWFLSLALNLNPLLRYDGYYFLSDLWNISNLQGRSFALGQWQLRKWFFGWDDPMPYVFPDHTRHLLVLFAICTWIYRLFLMLGVAALLYYLFFKVLAIVTMLLTVVIFIAAPIAKELYQYWQRRNEMQWNNNSIWTVSIIAVFILFLIVPWKASINVPGLLEYKQYTKIFVPASAQVQELNIQNNETVLQGQVLVKLDSPELKHNIGQLEYDVQVIQQRLRTELGKTENYGIRQADEEELAQNISALNGLKEQQDKLTIIAQYPGTVIDVNPELKPGVWLKKDDFLFELVNSSNAQITAYVPEDTVKRIRQDKLARFYPENYGVSEVLLAKIINVDPVSTEVLDRPYLTSVHGGEIPVNQDKTKGLVVQGALYRVLLEPVDPQVNLSSVTRGTVQLAGNRLSIFAKLLRSVSAVFIRESGF